MFRVRRFLIRAGFVLFACGAIVVAASAGPFSNLFVFGDSLSDVGNVQQATASIPLINATPGPYYYMGRFSNGPNYVESLASGLGLPAVAYSRSGGNNFAHGGAKTSGTSFPTSIVVRDVDDQVDDFLTRGAADANALFVVFSGANDLVGGQTNVNIPVNNLAEDIGRLITAGARKFLVPTLPLLGYTPRYNGNATTLAQYNTRTTNFNNALDTMLDGLEAGNPALTIFRLDVAGLFNEAIENPATFGLTNVTQSAAPGLQPGASSYNTSLIVPNANQYLFWDDLHPTTTVHAHLAEAALGLLLSVPGDFNHDGQVDTADYVVWRAGLGTTYTQSDYELWSMHFGQSSTGGLSTSQLRSV